MVAGVAGVSGVLRCRSATAHLQVPIVRTRTSACPAREQFNAVQWRMKKPKVRLPLKSEDREPLPRQLSLIVDVYIVGRRCILERERPS